VAAHLALLRQSQDIDKLDWFSAREEGLGNLYEGLLEKNAAEKKSGAGQYFTPPALIDCIIRLMQPQPGEVVQDPAAGTGGFIVAADHYIKDSPTRLRARRPA
jgi:type I restriction enzyme M protein